MNTALLATALLMGLAGSPHCLAMCGAGCAAVGRDARAMAWFQLGRLAGYAGLGGLAASSMQGLAWLGNQSAALRPAWALLHAATLALGLWLLLRARQPAWLDTLGRGVWRRVGHAVPPGQIAGPQGSGGTRASPLPPLAAGALWALMPCGLLYSALLVAALAGGPLQGAATMAAFAAGSGAVLAAGPGLWRVLKSLRGAGDPRGACGIRLAGAVLVAASAWALWAGLARDTMPWCVVP